MDAMAQVQSWAENPGSLGPLYPFTGWEVALVIVAVGAWLLWTIWQARLENRFYARKAQDLQRAGSLTRALLGRGREGAGGPADFPGDGAPEDAVKTDRNIAL
jgi:hypothetical protein